MINDNTKSFIGVIGGKGTPQVQADWDQSDSTAVDYIKNKPENLSDFNNDEGFITNDEVLNYKVFPESWPKTGTMSQLIAAIAADENATEGMSYLATVSYSDLPASMVQAEMQVDVMADVENLGKNVLFTVTSSNTAPYHWEYTSAYGAAGEWRGFGQPTVVDGNPTLAWNTQSSVGTINGTALHVTMPAQPTFTQTQANWNESDTESAAYIQNKPTIPASPVQSNWNESDTNSLAYIQNKPTIPSAPVQSNWNETDTDSLAYIQNKPSIPAAPVQSDWSESDSGSLAYIANKPTIPAAQVQTDWNAASGMGQLLNKPSNFVMGANNTAYTIWVGTQAEYDLLTPDASTVYLIKAS